MSVARSVEAPTPAADDDWVVAETTAGWTGSALTLASAAEAASAVASPVTGGEATASATAPASDRTAALASVTVLSGASVGRGGSSVSGSTYPCGSLVARTPK